MDDLDQTNALQSSGSQSEESRLDLNSDSLAEQVSATDRQSSNEQSDEQSGKTKKVKRMQYTRSDLLI